MATFADEVDITTDACSDTKMTIEVTPLSCDSATVNSNSDNNDNKTTSDDIITTPVLTPTTTTTTTTAVRPACKATHNEQITAARASTRICRACGEPCLKNDGGLVRALGETYHYNCFICQVNSDLLFFFFTTQIFLSLFLAFGILSFFLSLLGKRKRKLYM